MIGAPVAFPRVTAPPGWISEVRGPQRWLTAPASTGRIHVMPLQPLPPPGLAQFLEWVLVHDEARPLKRGPVTPLTTAGGLPGLWVDVAEVGDAETATGWRSYAAFELPRDQVALLFLIASPPAFAGLREVFSGVALSLLA